jgi:hypothetical protein
MTTIIFDALWLGLRKSSGIHFLTDLCRYCEERMRFLYIERFDERRAKKMGLFEMNRMPCV